MMFSLRGNMSIVISFENIDRSIIIYAAFWFASNVHVLGIGVQHCKMLSCLSGVNDKPPYIP